MKLIVVFAVNAASVPAPDTHLSSLFAGASRAMLLTFDDVEFGSEIERRGNSDEEGTPKEALRLGQVARS